MSSELSTRPAGILSSAHCLRRERAGQAAADADGANWLRESRRTRSRPEARRLRHVSFVAKVYGKAGIVDGARSRELANAALHADPGGAGFGSTRALQALILESARRRDQRRNVRRRSSFVSAAAMCSSCAGQARVCNADGRSSARRPRQQRRLPRPDRSSQRCWCCTVRIRPRTRASAMRSKPEIMYRRPNGRCWFSAGSVSFRSRGEHAGIAEYNEPAARRGYGARAIQPRVCSLPADCDDRPTHNKAKNKTKGEEEDIGAHCLSRAGSPPAWWAPQSPLGASPIRIGRSG